jgi:Na+/H+ antiporter NhaD/arsenite permease-like protein
MAHDEHEPVGRRTVPVAIAALILIYFALVVAGWPQRATQQIVTAAEADHHGHGAELAAAEQEAATSHTATISPPYWMVLPFVALLLAIAVLPLVPGVRHWWESNLHRFCVSVILSLIVLAYFGFLHRAPVEGHWPAHHVVSQNEGAPFQTRIVNAVFANAILQEYVPFIVLLFSLYTISGGIRITGDLQAHPMTNAVFMAVGAVLANVIGTTGAAMVLIRPLLETNRARKHVAHTVVFFIFIVCNCGGCLLPIGDPPLFLGYLQGVPFTWTLVLWKEWLFVNGVLLIVYLLMDTLWYYPRELARDIERDVQQQRRLQIAGWKLNLPLLAGIVLAVAVLDPSKSLPGVNWHSWLYLREAVELTLVGVSLLFGSQEVRHANRFSYAAIIEVAAIFFGIFITMQPALQILNVHGADLGITSPVQFFWATGGLSSVLDNAPTYLVFFQVAQTLPHSPDAGLVAGVEEVRLMGISLGAVFMGAMTYIGNGPNFMVRAIAEGSGVKMPSFFGYMLYSVAILLPVLAAMVWLYLLFPY